MSTNNSSPLDLITSVVDLESVPSEIRSSLIEQWEEILPEHRKTLAMTKLSVAQQRKEKNASKDSDDFDFNYYISENIRIAEITFEIQLLDDLIAEFSSMDDN